MLKPRPVCDQKADRYALLLLRVAEGEPRVSLARFSGIDPHHRCNKHTEPLPTRTGRPRKRNPRLNSPVECPNAACARYEMGTPAHLHERLAISRLEGGIIRPMARHHANWNISLVEETRAEDKPSATTAVVDEKWLLVQGSRPASVDGQNGLTFSCLGWRVGRELSVLMQGLLAIHPHTS